MAGLMLIAGSLGMRVREYLSNASTAALSSLIVKEMVAGNEVRVSDTSVPEIRTPTCSLGPENGYRRKKYLDMIIKKILCTYSSNMYHQQN